MIGFNECLNTDCFLPFESVVNKVIVVRLMERLIGPERVGNFFLQFTSVDILS